MGTGRVSIAVGLWSMVGFMLLGFVLIYLRDFADGKEEWVADYVTGDHFETRLAHVHGNLFALLNIALGLLLPRLGSAERRKRWLAALGVTGMLMPLGILGGVVLGLPPLFVLVGGLAMTVAIAWTAVEWVRTPTLGGAPRHGLTGGTASR